MKFIQIGIWINQQNFQKYFMITRSSLFFPLNTQIIQCLFVFFARHQQLE